MDTFDQYVYYEDINDTVILDMDYDRAPEEQMAYDKLKLLLGTVEQLISLRALRPVTRPKDLRRTFEVLPTAAMAIEDNYEVINGWGSVQKNPAEPGSAAFVSKLEEYALKHLDSVDIDHPESLDNVISAERKEMLVHVESEALTMSLIKFYQVGFRNRHGARVNVSHLYKSNPVAPNQNFYHLRETIELPTKIPLKSIFEGTTTTETSSARRRRQAQDEMSLDDDYCETAALTMLHAVYNGYGKFAPPRRSPGSFYAPEVKVDSRPVSVKLAEVEGCEIDQEKMRYDPIKIRMFHYDPQTARRKLHWHNEDLQSEIAQRQCAVWNEVLGGLGAWDADACVTVVSEQTETVCECHVFGTFAVIAEMAEEPSVPDEADWLKVAKSVGYFFSIPSLILFIIVLVAFPALHDQFHMLRLNTGICYFFTIIFLIVSADREKCEGRHDNMLVSSFLHYFALATSGFICSESFASIRAISVGVIGGKTWPYVVLSYGFPLLNMGLTFFFFGDDYGTDPRCFLGWENATKTIFFAQMLFESFVSVVAGVIVVINMTAPNTRREIFVDQLAAQGQGLCLVALMHALTWAFAYPAYAHFPDQDVTDFWPIFALLASWMGFVILVFMGFVSMKFRAAIIGFIKGRKEAYMARTEPEDEVKSEATDLRDVSTAAAIVPVPTGDDEEEAEETSDDEESSSEEESSEDDEDDEDEEENEDDKEDDEEESDDDEESDSSDSSDSD